MATEPPAINELIAILLRGHESRDFDYKAAVDWNEAADKKACCELVKDILAMANTAGGFIVIGVSEPPMGFSFDGVSPVQAKTFDTTRLNRLVYDLPHSLVRAGLSRRTNFHFGLSKAASPRKARIPATYSSKSPRPFPPTSTKAPLLRRIRIHFVSDPVLVHA
jgi:hypothetical protein